MRHEGSTLITDVLIIPGSLRPEHVQPLVDEIRLGKDLSVEVRVAPRRTADNSRSRWPAVSVQWRVEITFAHQCCGGRSI
jgi:hypothetical protein